MSDATNRVRPLNTPRRIDVTVTALQPSRRSGHAVPFISRVTLPNGKTRTIEGIGEMWRIDDEWWRFPIKRRYVEVFVTGGARLVIFEDEMTGQWWIQQPH